MKEYKNLKIHIVLKKIKNRYNRQHWEEIDEALNEIAELYTKFSIDEFMEEIRSLENEEKQNNKTIRTINIMTGDITFE